MDSRRLLTMIEVVGKKALTVSVCVKPDRSLGNKATEVWPKAFEEGSPAFTFVNTSANRSAFHLSPKMATSFRRTSWPLTLISQLSLVVSAWCSSVDLSLLSPNDRGRSELLF